MVTVQHFSTLFMFLRQCFSTGPCDCLCFLKLLHMELMFSRWTTWNHFPMAQQTKHASMVILSSERERESSFQKWRNILQRRKENQAMLKIQTRKSGDGNIDQWA